MISLVDYIKYNEESNINKDSFITKSFENYIDINNICNKYPLYQINEFHSKYNGQVTFCKSLAYSIEKFCKEHKIIPRDITLSKEKLEKTIKNGIFFKKIIIIKKYDILDGQYKSYKDDFDKENKILNKVTLEINPEVLVDSIKLFKVLMHEMLHAYDNYISYFKEAPLTVFDISKNDKYVKLNKKSKNIPEVRVKQVLQIFGKMELNAYVSELYSDLEIGLKEKTKQNGFTNYKDAIEILERTDHYKTFMDISEYLQNISEEDKEIFTKEFNDISETNYTWNKAYKKCIFYLNRYETKISEILPKYYYDIINKVTDFTNESVIKNDLYQYNIEIENLNNKEKDKFIFEIYNKYDTK